jgi:hypothetical protein
MSLVLRPPRFPQRRQGTPAHNGAELVAVVVAGQVSNPLVSGSPYRVGHDGVLHVVPGTGGIVLNRRVGDRAVRLAGDHVEPGVALRNNDREIVGGKGAPNRGLLLNACVGNVARVVTGPATGALGTVTGKHGGVNHVLVDFSPEVLRRLRIGDRVQVYATGQGMRFPAFPRVTALNLSPRLLGRWGIRADGARLRVPCSHLVPAGLMGSGLGRSESVLGDTDIQLSDRSVVRRFRLDRLRLGDLVAIFPLDYRFGPSRGNGITIGVVVHSDSYVSGHGPGVTPLLVSTDSTVVPVFAPGANLAEVLGVRPRVAPLPEPGTEERRAWALVGTTRVHRTLAPIERRGGARADTPGAAL